MSDSNKQLVRIVIAGSVDDGKSTMIGRLFYDTNLIYEDQYEAIKKTSQKRGGNEVDLSLFTDGLSAEREQGITIDVAYRYFSTPKKRFIIADVPGHEQYTRNMVTGASNADMALILIDAHNGITTQSKRHLFIASLLGIPHIIIVINKMDSISFKQETYDSIKDELSLFAAKLDIRDLQFIPVSALNGDMIVNRGTKMSWYNGTTLFNLLENIEISSNRNLIDFRYPIQNVIRLSPNERGYTGKVEGGVIKKGDQVMLLPSNKKSKIKNIVFDNKNQKEAFNPQSALITLNDQLDVSRGEMIIRENNQPETSDEIEAMISWFAEAPLELNKRYILKHTTRSTSAFIPRLHYRLNIDTLHRIKDNELNMNDIGRAFIRTLDPLFFDPYSKNRNTGNFILIDEITNNTIAAGIILRTAPKKSETDIIKANKKTGAVVWFTGLSGSGKSTIANALAEELHRRNVSTESLDGDIVRKSLTGDLGFSKEDRDENIKRVSFVAKLLSKHGVIVLASFISPYRRQRELIKKEVKNYIEVFVNAPLEICKERDVKGMYKKAKEGKIKDFTGISHPYEEPENPDLELLTHEESVENSVQKLLTYLEKHHYINKL
ncbi:adenylyl-sulfate kinase [Patescibacteria group bacterium]